MEELQPTITHIAQTLRESSGGAAADSHDALPQSGLLIGDARAPTRRVLLAPELSPGVVDEAIEARADLIITLLTPPALPLVGEQGRPLRELIRADIALYSAQSLSGGLVSGSLSQALDLEQQTALLPSPTQEYALVVVYTPEENAEELRRALASAGAGAIGDYAGCAWSVTGTGEFTPQAGADPTIGEIGTHEQVRERRLEMVVPLGRIAHVTKALRRAHPYEEPAFSFLATHQAPSRHGRGRIGNLPYPATVASVRTRLVQDMPHAQIRYTGGERPIRRVAISSRATEEIIAAGAANGAQVLISTDLTADTQWHAHHLGLDLIDVPRSAMLWMALPVLARTIEVGTGGEVETVVSTSPAPIWRSE